MQNNDLMNVKMRWLLVFFICVSLAFNAYALSYIFIYRYEDYIFSGVVVILASVFAIFEIALTLVNYHKRMILYKLGFSDNGFVNPIMMLTAHMCALIGLGLTVTGVVIFLIKDDISIRGNSLVILSIGIYVLINCVFYYFFILFNKKNLNY